MNMLARSSGPSLTSNTESPAGAPRTRGLLARWLGLALETHISLPLFALALLGDDRTVAATYSYGRQVHVR